jgi:hypothetical protein
VAGQRSREIAQRACVRDGPVTAGQLQLRRQRDRSWRLHLHRARAAAQARLLPRLFERIDVLVEQAGRPANHGAAAGRNAIAARHGVDADVHQQRSGPPDQVRAYAAARQFDQMRKAVQFADDDLCGFTRRRSRPRSDAGRCGEKTHSLTVFDRATLGPGMG